MSGRPVRDLPPPLPADPTPDALRAGMDAPLRIAGAAVPVGARLDLQLKVSESYTGARTSIPVTVVHGVRPGPVLAVTAAVHGDELNGVGIARELLTTLEPAELAGAVVVVPVVNVLGLQFHSRYLPDRRDLNRAFPGSPSGSMASRIAHTLMTEVITHADAGIDLHTASNHRTNVPQLRLHLDDERARRLAEAFGAPFLIDAARRAGSLRDAARLAGVPVLTYEAGQALRFDEEAITVGVAGVLRVLHLLGMRDQTVPEPARPPLVSRETHWVRAEAGGILSLDVGPGDLVERGQQLCSVTGPFGRERVAQVSPFDGAVIGQTTLPLVNPGDAMVHIAVRRDSWDLSLPAELDEPTDEEDVDEDDDEDDDIGT